MHRVFGIIGRSGSGKTTLIEAMIPWFTDSGIDVAVVKHSHHNLQFEPPHKDSARFRSAGAREVLVASPFQYALFRSLENETEPALDQLVSRIQRADVILVEGYRQATIPRLEVHRPSRNIDPVYAHSRHVVALATDETLPDCPLPLLDLNTPALIAKFIWNFLHLAQSNKG